MVLSIGMIVKNEEKYLERCLTALKPILENISSELIIADTGSTDKTVEIAKKFTDHVFHFEWINDFDAARNSTLERAKGEWYMFIDADEILQDCSDIIRFFKSEEYKKYNSATYIQRSYSDSQKPDVFIDQRVFRLRVKKDDLIFIKPIHEGLTPYLKPCRNLDLIADHSGYMFFDNGVLNEDAKKKGERNLAILTKFLADGEANGHVWESTYNQIADCYEVMGMDEKALEYVDKGLESIPAESINTFIYYNHKFSILKNLERFPEIIELSKQYFSENNLARKKVMLTDCYVYMVCGIAYCKLKNYSSAISSFIKCFDLYDRYLNKKLVTDDTIICPFLVTIPHMKFCYETFYQCCIHENKYDDVNLANKLIPISKWLDDHKYMFIHLMLRVEVMENTNFNRLRELYYKLDEYNRIQLIRIVRWHLFKTNKPDQMMTCFKEITSGNRPLDDTFKILHQHFIKKGLTFEAVEEYISKYGTHENEDILCIMLLDNIDITPYIIAADFEPEQRVREIYLNYLEAADAAALFAKYDINVISPQGLSKAAVVFGCALIAAQQNQVDITELFEKFGMIGARWFENFPDTEDVPGDILVAMVINHITSARKNRNYELCESEMRKLTSACPTFSPIVSEYNKTVQREIESSKPVVDPEFAMLAEQLKQNVRALIAAGNIGDAEELLSEYEKLCPKDPELNVLKKQIEAEK